MVKYLDGVALCGALVIVSMLLSSISPLIGTATVAILLGALLANTIEPSPKLKPGIHLCEKKGLELAVVLLGLQLPLQELWLNKGAAIGTVLLSLAAAGVTAWLIAKWYPKHANLSFFMGIGTAICGSSAIAAATPLRSGQKDAAALSIGVINLLGVLGLLGLPLLASTLQFNHIDTAALLGGTLQAVGHVAAAAMPMGSEVSQLAIPIKMSRVAMLVPTLLILTLFRDSDTQKQKTKLPWYLYGFMITACDSVFGLLPITWIRIMDDVTSLLITLAMVAIGMNLRLKSIATQLGTAAGIGVVIWFVQIGVICMYLKFF